MKNYSIFLLLVSSCVATLLPCKWVHIESNTARPSYYLRQSSHGSCHYQLASPNGEGKANEIVFFFTNLIFYGKELIVANCKVQKDQAVQEGCSFSFSSVVVQTKSKVELKAQRKSNYSGEILISLKEQNSLLSTISTKRIQIHGVQHIQQKNKTLKSYLFEYESISYLCLLIINLVLLRMLLREPIIKAHQWLQMLTIIKIIIMSLDSIVSINNHFQFEPIWVYNFLSVVLYFLNFIVIAFCLKLILDYIQFGPVQFKVVNQPDANSDMWLNEPNLEETTQKKNFANKIQSFFNYFLEIYNEKNVILKRIIWLITFILIEVFLEIQSYVLKLAFEVLLFVILPAYVELKNINTSTELVFDIFCFQVRDNPTKRDQAIFPKCKLHVFFIICLQYFAFEHMAYEYDALRLKLQLGLIVTLWVVTMKAVHLIANKKLGKEVKVYEVRKLEQSRWNKLKQNSKVLQFLSSRYQKLFKEIKDQADPNKKIDCCICLEEICVERSVETECGHIFHAKCLAGWTKNKMICPVDRNSLNEKMVERAIYEANLQK